MMRNLLPVAAAVRRHFTLPVIMMTIELNQYNTTPAMFKRTLVIRNTTIRKCPSFKPRFKRSTVDSTAIVVVAVLIFTTHVLDFRQYGDNTVLLTHYTTSETTIAVGSIVAETVAYIRGSELH